MSDENIGRKLKALRTYLGLSLTNFGKSIGFSQTHIKRFENGEYRPDATVIEKICELYNVDKRYFTGELDLEQAVGEFKSKAEINEETAARVKATREAKGLTVIELSQIASVDISLLRQIEAGRLLTRKQAEKLALALDVGVDWLLTGDESKKTFPVDNKMIDWLWDHESARKIIREWMEEE